MCQKPQHNLTIMAFIYMCVWVYANECVWLAVYDFIDQEIDRVKNELKVNKNRNIWWVEPF